MSQKTIKQHISALKGVVKIDNADNRLTDRHLYTLMFTTREMLLKQSKQWLMKNHDIFQIIPNEELIDVDVVEACGIQTNCSIKRSKNKIPKILEDIRGPIIKNITSLDFTTKTIYTTASDYLNKIKKSTFKYDKNIYFWVRNGYMYFPNVDWDMVTIEAYLEEDFISSCEEKQPCKNYQDNLFRIPGFMVEPMYRIIEEKLRVYIQIQDDISINKNPNLK